MNKNIVLFLHLFLVIPSSISLNAMDGDHKGASKSPHANAQKQGNKKSKNNGAQAAAGAGAGVSAEDDKPFDREAHALEVFNREMHVREEALKVLSLQAAKAQNNNDVVEVELKPEDPAGYIQQKLANYVKGTHTTLFGLLSTLKDNEIASDSLSNQAVILSAVTNLVKLCGTEYCVVKKADLKDISTLLTWAETRRQGKPVIKLDQGPARSLKNFLGDYQQKLYAEFLAQYEDKIKPIREITTLIDRIDATQNAQPLDAAHTTKLSLADMNALDKIMRTMAGQKPAVHGADAKKDQS